MKSTQVDTTTIEVLDFEHKPRCELRLYLSRRIQVVLKRCRRQAVWAANHPCCGAVSYLCDQHRFSTLPCWCSGCNADIASEKIRWVRL